MVVTYFLRSFLAAKYLGRYWFLTLIPATRLTAKPRELKAVKATHRPASDSSSVCGIPGLPRSPPPGVGVGVGLGVGMGLGVGLGLAVGVGLGVGLGLVVGVGLGVGLGLVVGVGLGVGLGVAVASTRCQVHVPAMVAPL